MPISLSVTLKETANYILDENGKLENTSKGRFIWETIKGFFGFVDHTRIELIDFQRTWLQVSDKPREIDQNQEFLKKSASSLKQLATTHPVYLPLVSKLFHNIIQKPQNFTQNKTGVDALDLLVKSFISTITLHNTEPSIEPQKDAEMPLKDPIKFSILNSNDSHKVNPSEVAYAVVEPQTSKDADTVVAAPKFGSKTTLSFKNLMKVTLVAFAALSGIAALAVSRSSEEGSQDDLMFPRPPSLNIHTFHTPEVNSILFDPGFLENQNDVDRSSVYETRFTKKNQEGGDISVYDKLRILTKEQTTAIHTEIIPKLTGKQLQDYIQQPDAQLSYLTKNQIQELTGEGLKKYIQRFDAQLSHLKKNQIQEIQFSDPAFVTGLGKHILQAISHSWAIETRIDQGIRNLNAEQIIDCINNDFFTKETAQLLTGDQVKLLDWNQITDLQNRKEFLENINLLTIREIPPGALQSIVHCFREQQLTGFTSKQIASLNFGAKEFPGVKILISSKKEICNLQAAQIIDCLNNNFFTADTAKWITVEQMNAVEWSRLTTLKNNKIFFENLDPNVIIDVSKKTLQSIVPFFTERQLKMLTSTQITSLNFREKELPGVKILQGIMLAYSVESRSNKGICNLKAEQIIDCLNNNFFTADTAKLITAEQMKAVDYSRLTNLPSRQIFFQNLNQDAIQTIPITALKSIYSNLIPSQQKALTPAQTASISA